MILTGFTAQAFGTNCYVLAPAPGEECVVVDPGIGVLDDLADVLSELGLRPAAVLLTHGHIDHVYSVTPVCGAHGVPALIHADDDYRLDDPLASMDRELVAMLEAEFGAKAHWRRPDDVRTLRDGESLDIAGLSVRISHAPGHTEGSVMFAVPDIPDGLSGAGAANLHSTVIAGDVLFAGSIGRTDLPGGDTAAMMRSLREKVLTLPDDVLVLPGHGPATTIRRERQVNPFLAEAARG